MRIPVDNQSLTNFKSFFDMLYNIYFLQENGKQTQGIIISNIE